MLVKIKRLVPDAVLPKRATVGSAAYDLTATSRRDAHATDSPYVEYGTGISVAIPPGYVGLLLPRSSVSKQDLLLANSVGVIDSDYRGEITFRFRSTGGNRQYRPGDRVGQLMVIRSEELTFDEVGELDHTERGYGCYGSSGR